MQDFKSTALKLPSEFCTNYITQCYTGTTTTVIKPKKSVPLQQISYR